jgi:hypothetical protein
MRLGESMSYVKFSLLMSLLLRTGLRNASVNASHVRESVAAAVRDSWNGPQLCFRLFPPEKWEHFSGSSTLLLLLLLLLLILLIIILLLLWYSYTPHLRLFLFVIIIIVIVTTPHLRLFFVCLFTFCINMLLHPVFPCNLSLILCCVWNWPCGCWLGT